MKTVKYMPICVSAGSFASSMQSTPSLSGFKMLQLALNLPALNILRTFGGKSIGI
jgi:hypothetical protein